MSYGPCGGGPRNAGSTRQWARSVLRMLRAARARTSSRTAILTKTLSQAARMSASFQATKNAPVRFRTFRDVHFQQPSERSLETARSVRAFGAVLRSQPKSKSPEEVPEEVPEEINEQEIFRRHANEKRHCSDRGIGRGLCVPPCIRAAKWEAGTAEPACRQSDVRCPAAMVYAARQ